MTGMLKETESDSGNLSQFNLTLSLLNPPSPSVCKSCFRHRLSILIYILFLTLTVAQITVYQLIQAFLKILISRMQAKLTSV